MKRTNLQHLRITAIHKLFPQNLCDTGRRLFFERVKPDIVGEVISDLNNPQVLPISRGSEIREIDLDSVVASSRNDRLDDRLRGIDCVEFAGNAVANNPLYIGEGLADSGVIPHRVKVGDDAERIINACCITNRKLARFGAVSGLR